MLTEEQKEECELRASFKQTDFSAQKAYERCTKTIRAEYEERRKREIEREIKYRREQEEAEKRRKLMERNKRAEKARLDRLITAEITAIRERCNAIIPELIAHENDYAENFWPANRQAREFLKEMRNMYPYRFDSRGSTKYTLDMWPSVHAAKYPLLNWHQEFRKRRGLLSEKISGIPNHKKYPSKVSRALNTIMQSKCQNEAFRGTNTASQFRIIAEHAAQSRDDLR